MSFTSRNGRETGRKLQTGQQSALEAIKRQRAGGSALDAVTIEAAKEIYEVVDDDEFERRQRKARRESFVEEDGGEIIFQASYSSAPHCVFTSLLPSQISMAMAIASTLLATMTKVRFSPALSP